MAGRKVSAERFSQIENNMWTYSPHPNGRFLVSTQSESAMQAINIITNWRKLAKN
jgi:hypothetical protein